METLIEFFGPLYKILEKFTPQKSKETETIDGSADEIVEKLIDVMKNKLRVIQ